MRISWIIQSLFVAILTTAVLTGCTQAEQQQAANTTERGLNEAGEVATNAIDKTTRVVSDVSITATIKGKMLATKGLPTGTIDVTTKNNVVTLAGSVQTAQQKQLAGQVAQHSPGVKQVVNKLAIKN